MLYGMFRSVRIPGTNSDESWLTDYNDLEVHLAGGMEECNVSLTVPKPKRSVKYRYVHDPTMDPYGEPQYLTSMGRQRAGGLQRN